MDKKEKPKEPIQTVFPWVDFEVWKRENPHLKDEAKEYYNFWEKGYLKHIEQKDG